MKRLHAAAVCVLLAAAGVAGAIAATRTVHLGTASAAPAPTDRAALRTRAHRLNTWAKALNGTLAKRPPALPALPRFGAVVVPTAGVPVAQVVARPAPHARAVRPAVARKTTASVRLASERSPGSATALVRPRIDDQPSDPQPAPGTSTTSESTTTPEPTTTTPAAESPPSTGKSPAPPPPPPATTTTTATHHDDGGGSGGGGEPPAHPEPGDD